MAKVFTIRFTKPFLNEEYHGKQKSIGVIARENGVGPSVIRRHMLYFGIPFRTKGEAQSLAESSGRRANPTKGRKRTTVEKQKIAHGISDQYWATTEAQKQSRAEKLRQRFNDMTDEQKERLQKASAKGLKDAAKIGSKFESYLFDELRRAGYLVEKHKKALIQNEEMHFDLFLPQHNLVIEVDGPSHLRPLYGKTEKEFKSKQERDNRKNSLIIQNDMRLIRLGFERADSIPKREKYLKELLTSIRNLSSTDTVVYIGDYNS
jgi:very-short-patch-repair endonuclease